MQQQAGSSGLEKPSSVHKPAWILMSLGNTIWQQSPWSCSHSLSAPFPAVLPQPSGQECFVGGLSETGLHSSAFGLVVRF